MTTMELASRARRLQLAPRVSGRLDAGVRRDVAKRALDIAAAMILLVLLVPVLAVVALLVRLDSAGPVLFRQERVGRYGRRFKVWKFRTMVADAEARRAALVAQSEDPHWLKLSHDPRITRIGRSLRLTSLDELPQLVNVVRGDMSLVGPRPLIADEASGLPASGTRRFATRPGLTGLWQVSGRTDLSFEEMVELDCRYVDSRSLGQDVRLLFRTVPVLLSRRGAN
jgi:exopolysaccharide production protein ExoY